MKFNSILLFLSFLFLTTCFVECSDLHKRSVSLAKIEIAGLKKLGIVSLFSNFLKGVQKTFLPPTSIQRPLESIQRPLESIQRPLESPSHSSKTVFVYRPKPEVWTSSTTENYFYEFVRKKNETESHIFKSSISTPSTPMITDLKFSQKLFSFLLTAKVKNKSNILEVRFYF